MEILVFSAGIIIVLLAACSLTLFAVIAEDRRIPVSYRETVTLEPIAVPSRGTAWTAPATFPPIGMPPIQPVPLR
jgi:hypothetical protein